MIQPQEDAPKPNRRKYRRAKVTGRGASTVFNLLSQNELAFVYKKAVEGYNASAIARSVNKLPSRKEKEAISKELMETFLDRHDVEEIVSKRRLEYVKAIRILPIADKKNRLFDLEKMRKKFERVISHLIEPGADINNRETQQLIKASNMMIQILNAARDEMEHRPNLAVGVTINQGDLSELTDEQLAQQRSELLSRAQRSLKSRVVDSDETSEGDGREDQERSSPVLLAPPEELRRDWEELPPGGNAISDV